MSCFSRWMRVNGRGLACGCAAAFASALCWRVAVMAGSALFTLVGGIFALLESLGVLTFFQLVKILSNAFSRQAPNHDQIENQWERGFRVQLKCRGAERSERLLDALHGQSAIQEG